MKYHYKSTQRMARVLTLTCFMLFVVYSMYFYIRYQADIMSLAYFIQSGMKDITHSATTTYIGALLCTILSAVPAIILLRTFHFPLRFKALSLLPSYIILGTITGIAPSTVLSTENEFPILASVFLLLFTVVLIILAQVYHEDLGEHQPLPNYMAVNIGISIVGMIFCMLLTNTNKELHVQLSMAKAIHNNDDLPQDIYQDRELSSNNTITAIQALTLSKQGILADKLFSVPHLNGSKSLLPDTLPAALLFHTPTLVYNHLQAVPVGKNLNVKNFLAKALTRRKAFLSEHDSNGNDSLRVTILRDYFLCALLLDKDLDSFILELPKYYNTTEYLPLHYREAIALYNNENSSNVNSLLNTDLDSLYISYKDMQKYHIDNYAQQRKSCVWTYPNSYWNYYYYGN